MIDLVIIYSELGTPTPSGYFLWKKTNFEITSSDATDNIIKTYESIM